MEVEEFKKLKTGKKTTLAKAHQIYDEYIKEQASSEVRVQGASRNGIFLFIQQKFWIWNSGTRENFAYREKFFLELD